MKHSFSFLDHLVEKVTTHLSKEHARILDTIVLFEARSFATRNLPSLHEPSMSAYTDTVCGAYNGLRRDVHIAFSGDIQSNLGTINIATANEKIAAKRLAIAAENTTLQNQLMDLQRIHTPISTADFHKVQLLLFLLAFGEITWLISAFIKLGDIILIGAIIGFAIGVAQLVAVKNAVQIIKATSNAARRTVYIRIGIVAAVVFSILIGMLRYFFIHTGSAQHVAFYAINPLTFAGINLLFVAATALLVFVAYPSKEALKNLHRYKDQEEKIAATKRNKQQLESELNNLMDEREFLIEVRARIISIERNMIEKVNAMYKEALGMFKSENISKRPDGGVPVAFKTEDAHLPEFELENNFINS